MSSKTVQKNGSLFDSFKNAFNGLKYLVMTQRNAKIHLLATIAVFVSSYLMKLQSLEFAILCLACGLVFALEAMNTAIEAVVDLVTDDYHELAKVAKDVAAGSVLIASFFAVITWVFTCAPRLTLLLTSVTQ